MASLISAISWIPRGAALQNPHKYVVDEAELERVAGLAQIRLDGARDALELAQMEANTDGGEEDEGEGEGEGDEDGNMDEAAEDVDPAEEWIESVHSYTQLVKKFV